MSLSGSDLDLLEGFDPAANLAELEVTVASTVSKTKSIAQLITVIEMSDKERTLSRRDHQIDLALATRLIAESGVFDAKFYCKAAGQITDITPVEHYVLYGWRESYEPSAQFEGGWLYPYFASAGLHDPPALTYATLQAAREPVFATRKTAECPAQVIRCSDLFDAESYAARVGNIEGLDPLLHYIIIGERLGYAPSAKFDPSYYLKRYPDVRLQSKCLLEHYLTIGKKHGRRAVSMASELTFDRSHIDPDRETILIVSHQASRTGAPILAYNIVKQLRARYNVVTLILRDGELFRDFESCSNAVIGPLTAEGASVVIDGVNYIDGINYVEGEYIAKRLKATYPIKYALVNSIDSRTMLKPLTCEMIPTVTLVHEFAADVRHRGQPAGEMGRWLQWTNQIVFSAQIVAKSVNDEYPHLVDRPVHILPQGPSELPPRQAPAQQLQSQALRDEVRPPGDEGKLVVLACGTVFARKGVDLFIACAARVAKLAPKRNVRFVWIGRGFDPSQDKYSRQLKKQIAKNGLSKMVTILDEVSDLEPAYASANVFFISSRLDPLPNVAIDSALRGIPIVCFEKTGGIADLLAADATTRAGVVPYLDVAAAANIIARLADDEPLRAELGRSTQRIAAATFDMDHYVDRLDQLGREAEDTIHQRLEDFETIRRDPSFDMFMFLEQHDFETTRDESIRLFLARAGALSTNTQSNATFSYRRPCPGFNPYIYVHDNASRYNTKIVNPLAHFIRSGKPDGLWRHVVITPSDGDADLALATPLRTAIHGHFFYPELISNFLEKLSVNLTDCDLLLSTNDERDAKRLHVATKRYERGQVLIRVVPNRGRDIGAFLTGFTREIADYDIIGHVHSKRSLHLSDRIIGEKWREFLWQNLLGGLYPMMDTVLSQFAKDDGLGLVFADDPHWQGWDLNRQIAELLARRIGWTEPLPPFFDFPLGTMFWARTRALEPLLRLSFDWNDYPAEPAPIDGTVLHAIERLLPFAARQAGYRYATTYIPGMTW
jgi:glycosyltransferase involved in cell wall biosynthesis